VLHRQGLPHSLGLLYEELTEHLGFMRSSDEYKVMGLAAHGVPRFLPEFRDLVRVEPPAFRIAPVRFEEFAPRRGSDGEFDRRHADLAASVQTRLEEAILELADWLQRATETRNLVMAGGVALNCVANARLAAEGRFDRIWVQPAAGDAGTSLGAALKVARELGDRVTPMTTAALGRAWSDREIEATLREAKLRFEPCADVAKEAARAIAADGIVAWFQGRSEFGPRALGHRSLLANPGPPENLNRLNAVKGREAFRPVAPMVTNRRAADIFEGALPSPYMLFTHRVKPAWRQRIAAAVHIDGSARIQTVDEREEPLVARMLDEVERLTGVPVVINTSLNTAGRPMVDSPRDALECFGSAPIDMLAIGSFVVRREEAFARRRDFAAAASA
ncbi:MAG: carbamoyltransferase, partial [Candidatus Eremiobacteraeota bacterium]|nr:carbamoyltransferase [Candidatus Eremiobacteraeota bacterium]